ncbi:hypothetical protein CSV69_15370 [Sporosarcina sp. P26b]|nr:hypothetical protein CSV69_15370 [Sporosarcina sp. P26b]
MQNIISTYKEYVKFSNENINIPIHYIIFLISMFLMYNPSYIDLINANSWVPSNIRDILLGVFDLIYSNIFLIYIVLMILFTSIYTLDKINIFNKILPNDEQFTDGTKVSWNQISALHRIIKCGIILITALWIYYFAINVLFNPGNYINNFFDENIYDFSETGYYDNIHSTFMQTLYYLNLVILICFIIRSLFQIKIPVSKYTLNNDHLSYYIEINFYSCTPSMGQEKRIVIMKDKYAKKSNYYLIEEHAKPYNEPNINLIKGTIAPSLKRPNIKSYEVKNVSRDLNEIIYHFDQLVLRLERQK